MSREGILVINNPVCKQFKSWINPAVLLEYSMIMTSSDTGEKWIWENSNNYIQMINQFIHIYWVPPLSLSVQGVQVKML